MRIKLLVMSVLLAAFGDTALAAHAPAASGAAKAKKERVIQLEQYWKIKPGMTRQQVVDVLGSSSGHDNRLDYVVRIEQPGKSAELRPVTLTFENDKLSKVDSTSPSKAAPEPVAEKLPAPAKVVTEIAPPASKDEPPVSSKPVAPKVASVKATEKSVVVPSAPVIGNGKVNTNAANPSEGKPSGATAALSSAEEEVWHTVQDWAAAWSARDPISFLAFYDNDYKPEEGVSFVEWRKQRREYFRQIKLIEVLVSKPSIKMTDAHHATAQFTQNLRSDQQRGESEKQMLLTKVGSLWMIVAERTLASSMETPIVAPKEIVVAPLPSVAPATAAPIATAPAANDSEAVWKTVEAWAQDWRARNADAFIGHYDSSFKPEDGSTQEAWSKRRRDYFKRVKNIDVALSDSEVEMTTPDQAEVRFTQAFRSDVFKEKSHKALTLVRTNGQWKIRSERAIPDTPAIANPQPDIVTPLPAAMSKVEIAKVENAQAEAAKAEADRVAVERAEAAKLANARVEAAKTEALKAEAARVEAARVAAAKAEAERVEAEKLAAKRAEAAKLAAARVEAEKIEAAKAEAARVEAARAAAAKAEADRVEAEKLAAKRADDARKAAAHLDHAETEVAKAEAARVAAVKAEAAKAEAARVEAARIETIKAEAAKAAAARAEAARLEAEKEAAARAEAARRENARIEAARAEAARQEAARAEAARAEAAKIDAARLEAAKAEAAKAEAARIQAIKAEAARVEAVKAEAARLEATKAETARLEAARSEAAARVEAARLEALRAESARQDAARLEAAKTELLRMELARAQALSGGNNVHTAPVEPAPAAPIGDPATVGLEAWTAVQGWANAWMARNADAFLGYYGPTFVPEDGSPRQAWEERRRQYFNTVKKIQVSLDNPVIDVKDGNHVDVRFTQSFSSDIYRESGKPKTLNLEKVLGHWKIVAEQSGAVSKSKPTAAVAATASNLNAASAAPLPVTRAETEQIEAAKAEAARKEAARIEADKLEAAKAEAVRLESAKADAARAEAARIESERAASRLNTAKAEAAKAEAAKAEAAKAEAARAETARKEAAKSAEIAKEAAVRARRDCLMSRKCREETAKMEESQALQAEAVKPTSPREAAVAADLGPEVWKSVQSWVADWKAKDANKFLKHYDKHFIPEDGSTYAAWEKRRRDHFSRVKSLNVELTNSAVEILDEKHASVSFTQDFRADSYHDVSDKTLLMALTPIGWVITAEHALPSKVEAAKAEAARAEAIKAEAARVEAAKAEAARAEAERVEAAKAKAAAEAAKPAPAKVEVAKMETTAKPEIKAEVVPAKTAASAEAQAALTNSALQVVKAWSQAWEARNIDNYLSHYSHTFKPVGGESQAAWEMQRRARIGKARSINIELEDLTAKLQDDHHVQVSFIQHYRAEQYQDVTRKVLDLVKNEQGWQIEQERTDSAASSTATSQSSDPAKKPAKGRARR